MANTCTFAPTTRLRPSNQFFFFDEAILSPFFDVNSGRKVVSVASSLHFNMHNSLHYQHNSDWDKNENVISAELTITACEESNMLKAQNLFRLDQIAKLEENWNGYGARPFSQDLVDKCKDIISELELQPKIFPTGRQSIQFQYELEDRSYLEFEIFREKISYLEVPQRRYSDARTFEFPISETKRIKEIIKEFYGQDGSRERNIVPGG